MTILSTVLVAMPPAFMAGWLLAKVVCRLDRPATAPARDRDTEVAALEKQLAATEALLDETRVSFEQWRERTRPVAKQFRQQRKVISELRSELRRRDAALAD